uniref:Uncharacterized protein n=1 Tax=Anopheles maculatus TaxID=74869 RepID=A0A182SZC3_9DIPT
MNGNGHYNGHRADSEENLHKPTHENGANSHPAGPGTESNEPNFERLNFMGRLSYHVSIAIGKFFYRLGYWIANNAWKTIGLSVLLVAVCSVGFIRFHKEKSPMKLWIPLGSKFQHDTNWLIEHFQEGNRIETVMITAPDVLVPEVLQTIAKITEEIEGFTFHNSEGQRLGWTDVCHKVPFIAEYTADHTRRKRHAQDLDRQS